jgi:hypothetical protein
VTSLIFSGNSAKIRTEYFTNTAIESHNCVAVSGALTAVTGEFYLVRCNAV